jgi:NAD(P)-dependent dehydrogenase (short-subunit alcohol dehydrogenase family)/DNA-binding CsgD family transcriptional regulator
VQQSDQLVGSVAVVTGAGRGLGRAIACAMADAGARVVVTGRQAELLDRTVKAVTERCGEARALPCDVSDPAAARDLVPRAAQLFGTPDILVNNAGQAAREIPSDGLEPEEFDRIFATNVRGVYYACLGAAPLAAVEIERQAAMIGVDVGRPHRALVLAVGRADASGLARSHRVLLEHVQPHANGRVMTGYHRGMVVLLAADATGLPAALDRAVQRTELPLPSVIGVGDPRPRLGEIGASCREAVAAAEVSLTVGRRRTTAYFEDVLPEVLLRDNPVTARRLVSARLGPLLGRPVLLETLVAYLDAGLSLRGTAKALRIHENTASYRLQRILELLGVVNAAALVRADLQLALLAHRLTTAPTTAG